MKKTSFIVGTIILACINFLVRSLGFVYRIILSRVIGPQAIGLYQMVFPFLMVLITIPTAGIPIAVSKLVAKENSLNNRKGVYRTLWISMLLGGILALILTIIVSLKIDYITISILKNDQLFYPLLWSIPAIALITFSSILRGFFYGLTDVKPAAAAQIVEQVTRVFFVLLYLYLRKPSHPITAATIAIIGLSVGEAFGLLYLVLRFNFRRAMSKSLIQRTLNENYSKLLGSILFISVPITISRLISTLMQSVNAIIIPQRLQFAGYTAGQSLEIFGKISGMAMPLLFLPFTVTSALVVNIIPNISEQMAVNNLNDVANKSNLALKLTMLTALPTTVLFVIFGNHIATLIYNQKDVGSYLAIISYVTVFLCMNHTLSGILHGMGKQISTTINYILGMLIQLYCTYYLIPNPRYGINGFFIGYIISAIVIFILNSITLRRHIKLKLRLMDNLLKPLLCTAIMTLGMFGCYRLSANFFNSNTVNTITSLMIGSLLYCFSLIFTKTIDVKHIIRSIKA